MTFPDYERVVYNKNPLQQVSSRLDFPPILRIGPLEPIDFQDALRAPYPLYEQQEEALGEPAFVFVSADEQWEVRLSRTSVGLVSYSYERWEDFQVRLVEVLRVFATVYSPAFYERVALQYTDVIARSLLYLDNVPWSELLAPQLIGLLSSDVAQRVSNTMTESVITLEDVEGRLRLLNGLVRNTTTDEIGYLLESEFFASRRKANLDDAIQTLNALHQQAGRFFRWCITEKLHQALNPQSL
jgi:uncharacterized protein (TIGR04255 family)